MELLAFEKKGFTATSDNDAIKPTSNQPRYMSDLMPVARVSPTTMTFTPDAEKASAIAAACVKDSEDEILARTPTFKVAIVGRLLLRIVTKAVLFWL